MRIGMDGRCLATQVNGIAVYVRSLAQALVELGHDVHLATNEPLPEYASNPRTIMLPSRIGSIKTRSFSERVLLPVATRCRGLDVLHLGGDPVSTLVHTCPQVATIHDLYCYTIPELYEPWQADRLRTRFADAARNTDAIITISGQSMSDIVRFLGVPEQKVTVVPLAAREDLRRMSQAEREAARVRLGLPERFVLCITGRNARMHKNIHRVVEALGALTRVPLDGVHLAIVASDTRYLAYVREQAEKLGVSNRLLFLGIVDAETLCTLYNLASAFAFPSLREGFGLPILEAMTCGTPVVTSNYGAMKEVAEDAALLVDPNDPEAIADALKSVLTEPELRNEYSRRGVERAGQFTWRKTAEMTLDVYHSICRR